MCTIFILYRIHPEYPLIIAANRDEYYAREATTPLILEERDGVKIVGGQDREKGGTWMAVSTTGRFAGLTNQRTGSMPDKSRKSRGEVVLSALRASSVEEAKREIAAQDPRDYNPFNLLFGDAQRLYVAYCHDEKSTIEINEVTSGFWVLPNDVIDSQKFRKVTRAKELLKEQLQAPWSALQRELAQSLADHQIQTPYREIFVPKGSLLPTLFWRQLEALCIHTPVYGTRSATIVAASHNKIERYLFSDEAPCKNKFQEYTHLL